MQPPVKSLSCAGMPDVLRPLLDQDVIKELEPERMRKSGLLVPQGTHDLPPNEGIVLAVGEGPPNLLALQQVVGNGAVGQMLARKPKPHGPQPKKKKYALTEEELKWDVAALV